jgi:hypothetical protein
MYIITEKALKPNTSFFCIYIKHFFLFATVRIWEFSPNMWTNFDKRHNMSKRNVKLILKILSDLEPSMAFLVAGKKVSASFNTSVKSNFSRPSLSIPLSFQSLYHNSWAREHYPIALLGGGSCPSLPVPRYALVWNL